MKTVAEVLKESGFTDEQIAAMDQKAIGGFTTILSTAQQSQEKAELAQRSVDEKWQNDISPALDKWGNEKAAQDAENAALRAALKAAEEGGFKIPEMLKTAATAAAATPTRTADGKFVAGTTGSPEFVKSLRDDLGASFSFVADTSWKYRTLYGTEMPDSPTTIIREAAAQRMQPSDYAAKKYDFAGKEKAKREAEQKAHDDGIRKETEEKKDREWSEKMGSNPDTRRGEVSGFSQLSKAVSEKQRPNPLGMTREERHRATSREIQKDIAANAEAVH